MDEEDARRVGGSRLPLPHGDAVAIDDNVVFDRLLRHWLRRAEQQRRTQNVSSEQCAPSTEH
jgi:hypothetical protein